MLDTMTHCSGVITMQMLLHAILQLFCKGVRRAWWWRQWLLKDQIALRT